MSPILFREGPTTVSSISSFGPEIREGSSLLLGGVVFDVTVTLGLTSCLKMGLDRLPVKVGGLTTPPICPDYFLVLKVRKGPHYSCRKTSQSFLVYPSLLLRNDGEGQFIHS